MDIGLIGLRWFSLFHCITIQYSEKSCDPAPRPPKERKSMELELCVYSIMLLLSLDRWSQITYHRKLVYYHFMRNGNIVCVTAN